MSEPRSQHSRFTRGRQGFTLIELLIVVAIIAILAAIAVPNFLEAQVRSKVSRAKNDLRSLAVGLESYRTENNDYPYEDGTYAWIGDQLYNTCIIKLTSPIAYLSSVPNTVFAMKLSHLNEWGGIINANQRPSGEAKLGYMYESSNNIWVPKKLFYRGWAYTAFGGDGTIRFELSSVGPCNDSGSTADAAYGINSIYDPSNGTVSWGHIFRCEKGQAGR